MDEKDTEIKGGFVATEEMNFSGGERVLAILIIDGKTYISDCDHQECLALYYQDNGITSDFDWSQEFVDEVQKAAEKKTFAMKENHEIYGFDVFELADDDYILIAHDKETLEANIEWAKDYVKEDGMKIGYFLQGYDAVLVEEKTKEVSKEADASANPEQDGIITALVKVGEWEIDEEAFRTFRTATNPLEIDHLASLKIGNHIFDINGNDEILQEMPNFSVNIDQYVPLQSVDNSYYSNHGVTGGQATVKEYDFNFTTDKLSAWEYYECHNSCTFERTDDNCSDIDKFKRAVISDLLQRKMLLPEPKQFAFMKEHGVTYHQQLDMKMDQYFGHFANESKLSKEKLDNVSRYYHHKYFSSDSVPETVTKIYKLLDTAGYSETRKNVIFHNIAKLYPDEVKNEILDSFVQNNLDKALNKDSSQNHKKIQK